MYRQLQNIASRSNHCTSLVSLLQCNSSIRLRSTVAVAEQLGFKEAKPFDAIPGPKPLPIIGNIWRFLPGIGEYVISDTYGTHTKLINKYGNIVRVAGIPGRPDLVLSVSPSDLETVFRSDGPWPVRQGNEALGHYYKKVRADITGGRGPTLSTQGKEWHELRSAVQQPIMQPKTARMYISSIEQVTNEFIQRIRDLRNSKNEMPDYFRNELYKWSLESIALIALDARLGCLSPNLSPDSEPQKVINAVQIIFDSFAPLEFGMPLWKYFPTPAWNKFKKAMDIFTDITTKHIQEAVDSLKSRSADSEDDLTLLQRLLRRDPDPGTARLVAFDLLFAGIDTTSLTVASLLYFLAKNPTKQQKLYEEICQVLPTTNTPLTSEKMNDMRYLRACLKECLRIAPVATGNFRLIAKDVVLSGYFVPKGTMFLSNGIIMSSMDQIFPMAKEFIPERWLKGDDTGCPFSNEKPHPFATVPFGHGPRSCLGRRFAEMEIQMLTAKVIQNFEVQFNYEGRLSTEEGLLYSLNDPLKFTMKDRK